MCVTIYVTKCDSPGRILECIQMSMWWDEQQFEWRNHETKKYKCIFCLFIFVIFHQFIPSKEQSHQKQCQFRVDQDDPELVILSPTCIISHILNKMLFKDHLKKKNTIPHPLLSIRKSYTFCQSALTDKHKTNFTTFLPAMCIVPSEKRPTPAETVSLCREIFFPTWHKWPCRLWLTVSELQ